MLKAGLIDLAGICFLRIAVQEGVISSAVSGFLAIHFLLKFIKRSSLNIFVFYRIAFAIIILTFFIMR